MPARAFDVLVVGAGPAGSVAAFVLARGGARVALVDKATFPRDKACGDLIGPRGVQLLNDLDIDVGETPIVDDMVVVGPARGRARLPCYPGITYPGFGVVSPRFSLDSALQEAAIVGGAETFVGRADEPIVDGSTLKGFTLSSGERVHADFVIGADGANSRVANVAGLVDHSRVLWGFALRAYLADPVQLPHLVFWEPTPWHAFPGYGWLFPGVDGRANVGLGLGMLADRRAASHAQRHFDAFLDHLWKLEILSAPPIASSVGPRLGGWLKMGMIGTTPARDGVLLVGDAAGLVNPLQGEGISQAMRSGRAAAEAIIAGPAGTADGYRSQLRSAFSPYNSIATPVHSALLPHPIATAAIQRVITAPGVSRLIAGTWSLLWNDLLDGATPRAARTVAATASRLARTVAGPTDGGRWFAALERQPRAPSRNRSTLVTPAPALGSGDPWMGPGKAGDSQRESGHDGGADHEETQAPSGDDPLRPVTPEIGPHPSPGGREVGEEVDRHQAKPTRA
jgi:geranylgeranyl reductase family protein